MAAAMAAAEQQQRMYDGRYSDVAAMQRQYSYNPPNEDLVNAVVLLVTYLLAEVPGNKRAPGRGGGAGAGAGAGGGTGGAGAGAGGLSPVAGGALEALSPRSPGGSKRGTQHAAAAGAGGAEVDMAEEVERAKAGRCRLTLSNPL